MKLFPTLAALALSGCAAAPVNAPLPQPAHTYEDAVRDAAIVNADEIAHNLIAITPSNPKLYWNADKSKIKVVTWKSQASYERYLKPNTSTSPSPANVVWVSTAPEVQQFCQNFTQSHNQLSNADLELRLKQFLGLNPDWQYDVFVELWVSPQDLFRPCQDPEINDSSCTLSFSDPVPVVQNIPDYPSFYKNLYFSDFRSLPGVPWTGLGYTYDWGNPNSAQGASEFILRPGAAYETVSVTATADYCHLSPAK